MRIQPTTKSAARSSLCFLRRLMLDVRRPMKFNYEPPPEWQPPKRVLPSSDFQGESSTAPIHETVGRSLSTWEHAESANIKLFQVLCETRTFAACRAYGTLESVFARHLALRYAGEEFFEGRDKSDLDALKKLVKDYRGVGEYRNKVAHGMAVQPHGFGYFLCPPSYASRRRETPRPGQRWALGADYFYRVREIDQITNRFNQILRATMSLALYLNERYSVLGLGEFHP